MPLKEKPYNREATVEYAHKWAFSRNPRFYDFTNIGGDCTNFASQCVYAGTKTMNYNQTNGWYYNNLNSRSPSWTSVEYFYRFMTTNKSVGPYAESTSIEKIEIGDLVQIRFFGSEQFNHTLVVVDISDHSSLDGIQIACHTYDSDYRSVSSYYSVEEVRFLHIIGYRTY